MKNYTKIKITHYIEAQFCHAYIYGHCLRNSDKIRHVCRQWKSAVSATSPYDRNSSHLVV
jgi:hypothetical protein